MRQTTLKFSVVSCQACLINLAVCLLFTSCSQVEPQPTSPEDRSTRLDLVWPQPPETPRIAFQAVVVRPTDLGISRSTIARFSKWLTGSEKGNERLAKPFAICLDELDNISLTDTGAGAVCFYDKSRRKWSRWEKTGKIRFASPVGIACREGVIYVADSTLGCVVGITTKGDFRFSATNGLSRPSGVAVGNGKLFVADSQEHCVVVLDTVGRLVRIIGKRGTGPGEFNFPTHIHSDSNGHLYVTDSMNGRVQILDQEGNLLGQIGELGDARGHFSRPKGVAVDPNGRVYVIDALFDNVQVFEPSGRLLMDFGRAGSAEGEFWLPNGIAISRNHEIYVADCYNHRIQVFKYVGPS